MRNRNILELVLKTLGVIMLSYTILSIQSIILTVFMFLEKPSESFVSPLGMLYSTIGAILSTILMGLFLIKYAEVISHKLIKHDEEINLTLGKDWEYKMFSLVIKIIGIIFFAKGFVLLPKCFYNLGMEARYIISRPNLYSVILYLLVGFYLLLGGRLIVNFVFRNREEESIHNGDNS